MPCSKSAPESRGVRRALRWCLQIGLTCLACVLPLAAGAAGIDIRAPELVMTEEGYGVAADIQVELGRHLEEAVLRGVILTFRADFELLRPRWYWFDEKIVTRSQSWQLSYHALTRRYRLSSGVLHQNFSTLTEAVRVMLRLRRWTVIERGRLAPGTGYRGALRFLLDTSQLPKPFQLAALGNRDWELASDWVVWAVDGVDPVPPAEPVLPPVPEPAK